MNEFYRNLELITSRKEISEQMLVEAADSLIKFIADKPAVSDKFIHDIQIIYDHDFEIVKIRAIEVSLKLLDYSLYENNKPYADKILSFLKNVLPDASENVQSSVIIHYSWAHRKFPKAKMIIQTYDNLLKYLNTGIKFNKLYDEINHMEGPIEQNY